MRCVPAHDFTVAKAMAWRSSIADDPPYQRASGVWNLARRQLFIDSLLNGYDVPKIYLHDLRGKHPTRVYAVVDGKQRLSTIWEYLTDGFALADDYRTEPANLPDDLPAGVRHPRAGQRFSELDPAWQRVLRGTYLAVVLIQKATPADIEDLFSRLNNGEPLNAAERRNALGGDAMKLARAVASHRFFAERVRFSNARYAHLEAATRVVVAEWHTQADAQAVPDLRPRALDAFVREHRRIPAADRRSLLEAVRTRLDLLAEVFGPDDPLLGTQAALPVYYLLARRFEPEALGRAAGQLRDALQGAERPRGGAAEPGALARRLDLLVSRLETEIPDLREARVDSKAPMDDGSPTS